MPYFYWFTITGSHSSVELVNFSNCRIDVMEAEISLPEPKMIFGVDVGNFWSASIEVQVGLSDWPQSKREVLLKVSKSIHFYACEE